VALAAGGAVSLQCVVPSVNPRRGENLRSLTRRAAIHGAVLALAVSTLGILDPSRAGAAVVQCGDTLTTDTRLDRDLLHCPEDGLFIGADNITIDLNGHILTGPGTADHRFDGIDAVAGVSGRWGESCEGEW